MEPNTVYAYRVGQEGNWSEWFHFRTTSDQQDKFSFLYFGDAQSGIHTLWSRVIREAYAKAPDARLMLHAGGLINRSTNDEEWGELFEVGFFIHVIVINISLHANHAYYR